MLKLAVTPLALLALLHSSTAQDCVADLDGDGSVAVPDLLALLGWFDSSEEGDLNGDGTTSVVDLLILLGDFGSVCGGTPGWASAGSTCFGAGGPDSGDDSFGSFSIPEDTVSLKLVYTSGGVSCNYGSRGYHSNWGCDLHDDAHMGTFITTATNGGDSGDEDIVAPPSSRIDHDNYWWLPYGENSPTADQLVFTDGADDHDTDDHDQIAFPQGDYLLWYGEDLRDQSESDNDGSTCVDVYYMSTGGQGPLSCDSINGVDGHWDSSYEGCRGTCTGEDSCVVGVGADVPLWNDRTYAFIDGPSDLLGGSWTYLRVMLEGDGSESPCGGGGGGGTEGGFVGTLSEPAAVAVCCANHCGTANVPTGADGWFAHPGSFAITDHNVGGEGASATPCTFYENNLDAGDYEICCSTCWATGLFFRSGVVGDPMSLTDGLVMHLHLDDGDIGSGIVKDPRSACLLYFCSCRLIADRGSCSKQRLTAPASKTTADRRARSSRAASARLAHSHDTVTRASTSRALEMTTHSSSESVPSRSWAGPSSMTTPTPAPPS